MTGDNATVIVTGLGNATGNVSVFANLHNWTGKINNGVATVIIPNLKENTTAVVMYPSDYTYNLASTKVDITVYRYDLNINASAEPTLVEDNATVIVTGLKDATSNITVTIKGNNWTGKINKGTAQIIVT